MADDRDFAYLHRRGREGQPGRIKAAAYAYAEGGPIFDELILSRTVDRFGAQAVFGRTLSFHEIRMMSLADNVVNAYQSRANYRDKDGAVNWSKWAELNPDKANLLADAGKLYDEEE